MTDPAIWLPSETFAHILSFLDPPDLVRSAAVSKAWTTFCYDEALWKLLMQEFGYFSLSREVVAQERVIAVAGTLHFDSADHHTTERSTDFLHEALRRYRDRNISSYFDDCQTVRALCCQLWKLECNWSARAYADARHTRKANWAADNATDESEQTQPPSFDDHTQVDSREFRCTGLDPYVDTFELPLRGPGAWRLKLDPFERTIIASGQSGGIQVYDQATKELLWHIPRTATRPSPHLEFSNGYLIFDRPGLGHFEIWRNERLVPDLGRPADRGHYQRMTILSSTRPIRAYRFQFPYLAMASQSGFIELWHVPTATLAETIDMSTSTHREGNITYIDFDDEFVFLCGMGSKSVSVFSRHTKHVVWTLGQHFVNGGIPPQTLCITSTDESAPSETSSVFVEQSYTPGPPNLWQSGPNTMNLAQLTMMPWQIWSAVHPDLKTNTLLILGQGTVLLIRDYKRYFRDPTRTPSLFVEIKLWDLARFWENDPELVDTIARTEYAAQNWNNIRMWQSVPEGHMSVHEGKAFVVNGFPIVIDLSQDKIRIWKDRASGSEPRRDAWKTCSCVQMDETGMYYVGQLEDEDPAPFGPPSRRTRIICQYDLTRRGSQQRKASSEHA